MEKNWSKLLSLVNTENSGDEYRQIALSYIEPNPYQPRRNFESLKIDELAQSIKTYGLIQPIIVRKKGDKCYQIVAGERRFLACQQLQWSTIPAFVRELSDSAMAAIALIENLQRENLHYLEEAEGYARLINEFNLTQEVLAQRLGKSQSTIANKLRLLKLPQDIKDILINRSLSERHARTLLRLNDSEEQRKTLNRVIEKGLTVKEIEREIERHLKRKETGNKNRVSKSAIKDLRIFLNTVRQAVRTIKKAGLSPVITEKDLEEYWEIVIRLPKNKNAV